MDARIVKKSGTGVRGTVYFEAESHLEITPDMAKTAQTELGYHPAGYGFSQFEVKKELILLRYRATWACQASCD